MIRLTKKEFKNVVKYIILNVDSDLSYKDIYKILNGKSYKSNNNTLGLFTCIFPNMSTKPYILFKKNNKTVNNSIDIQAEYSFRSLRFDEFYLTLDYFVETYFLDNSEYCYLVNIPYEGEETSNKKNPLLKLLDVFLTSEHESLFKSKIKLMELFKIKNDLENKINRNHKSMEFYSDNLIICENLNKVNGRLLEELNMVIDNIIVETKNHQSLQEYLMDKDIKKRINL